MQQKSSLNIKRFSFYFWVGLAYVFLWLINYFVQYPETFFLRAVNEVWRAVFVTLLNIVLFEFTIPFIKLRWKRIVAGILLLWGHLMLYSFGLYAWRSLGIAMHVYTPLTTFTGSSSGVEVQMSYSVGSIVFFGVIRHIYRYIKLKQAAQQLLIEKQQAELNYLKSQTNPHFLFNTLNNIYSLARDKSDRAPESILQLSKILRYMLYETTGAYIAIEQELKIMNDYIALERLRYDESLHINFNYNVEDMKQALPPLLLIPLVENAFKHGVAETRHHPYVDIHLSVRKRELDFIVKNSSEPNEAEKTVRENIGLSNLRRQLELLFKEFSLTVHQGEHAFVAELKINLASHV